MNSKSVPMTIEELLLSISEYEDKVVGLNGMVNRDRDFNVFIVGETSPTKIELLHSNLYSVIRESGVPINVPHGLLHKATVRGTVRVEEGTIRITEISLLIVHGIRCL